MKKRIAILLGGLLGITLGLGLVACGKGGDNSSSDGSSSSNSSVEEQIPYTITYNLGECANNPDAIITDVTQTVYYDEAFTLYTPTCGLYQFLYWTVQGEDQPFTASIYPFEDDVTLVAKWNAPRYISYNLGVCENNPDAVIDRTQQLVYNGETFEMPTPTCGLYQFLYWTLDGQVFSSGTYNLEKDITLVAKWKTPYYVSLNLGEVANNPDAQLETDSVLIYYGDKVSLPTPTCGNYKFMGWTVQDTGESFNYYTYPFESDVNLVANWKAPCVITYHLGDLEGSNLVTYKPQPQTVYYDELFAIRIPSATGYKFVRWEVQGSGEVFDGGRYTYQTDITVVAVWEQPYTITYKVGEVEDASQVVIGSTTQSVYYGDTFTLQQPTCPGYNFLGWKIEGQDAFFTDTVYNFKEDIVLVAYWQIRDYSDPH